MQIYIFMVRYIAFAFDNFYVKKRNISNKLLLLLTRQKYIVVRLLERAYARHELKLVLIKIGP